MAADLYSRMCEKIQLQCGKRLLELIDLKLGHRVADIGCGTGNLAYLFSEKVGSGGYVIGIDPDEERISVAKNSYEENKNMNFMACKGEDFVIKDQLKFDVVYSNIAMHWMNEDAKMLTFQRVYNALNNSGRFAFLVPLVLPTSLRTTLDTAPPEVVKFFNESLHFCSRKRLEEIAEITGFEVEHSDEKIHDQTERLALDEYLKWVECSMHGVHDFSAMNNIDEIQLETNDSGLVKHCPHLIEMVLRKAE